jgi:hypothetical protein
MEGITPVVDHVLLLFTVAGQVTLAAFTATHEDCVRIKYSVEQSIVLHNSTRPKGFQPVNVMLKCTAVPNGQ